MALTPPPVEAVVVAEESVINVPDESDELVAEVSVYVASRCSPQLIAAATTRSRRNRMPRLVHNGFQTYVTKGAEGGL